MASFLVPIRLGFLCGLRSALGVVCPHSVTLLLVRINTVISSNSTHSNGTVVSMCVCPAGCVVAAAAMKPRMLLTLDGEGQLLSVPVRLGQAVDVVAQAGRPKTITGTLIGLQSIRPA